MRGIVRLLVLLASALFLLGGCGGSNTASYNGSSYPASTKVIPVFQPRQVPVSCRVFAQVLVRLPVNSTGKTIAQAVEEEAKARGADMVLIGESRRAADDGPVEFSYYGPEREYNCREKWPGWKFGYSEWSAQGDWVTLGFKEWGNAAVSYDFPIVMQVAFLRCQE
jgi:hypothetical protein